MGIYRIRERKIVALNKREYYIDKQNNKLELYLKDVYTLECVIKATKEEIGFIQTGIETLVTKIADSILEYFEEYRYVPDLDDGLIEILKNREPACTRSEIVKVGSFYEKTKNGFTDEFDFIFPLFESDCSLYCNEEEGVAISGTYLLQVIMMAFLGLSAVAEKRENLLYYHDPASWNRKLYFKEYYDAKGPAAKLLFIYEDENAKIRNIHVDFVPAIKINGDKLEQTLNHVCELNEFRTEVLSTGSYFLVADGGYGITFTETEVKFMRGVLSEKHTKAYRILKYLISGDDDGEVLGLFLREKNPHERVYTSFMLKTMMIRHHYKCKRSDQNEIGACVVDVLDEMSTYEDIDSFPKLACQVPAMMQFKTNFRNNPSFVQKQCFSVKDTEYPILIVSHLRCMTLYLKFMWKSHDTDLYNYERDRLKKSLSKMYLDDLTTTY